MLSEPKSVSTGESEEEKEREESEETTLTNRTDFLAC